MHATVEDRGHVRAEVAPGETQRDDQREDGEEEAHLEFLRLEHRVADVKEHHDGDDEEEYLRKTHTRSNAQMSPSIAAVKAMIPSAE